MVGLLVGIPPWDVLEAIIPVLVAGVIVIFIAHLLIEWKNTWFQASRIKRYKEFGAWDTVRDIGIALFVAGIVSGIYEWSTRSIDQNKKEIDVFNKINSYTVGTPVWTEIKNEIFHAPLLRRNIQIKLKLLRDWALASGEKVSLPPNRAVLWMEYIYDLYPLTNESWEIPVQHGLNYEMFDKSLGLPRFERVKIMKQQTWDPPTREIKGDDLKNMVNGEGALRLDLPKLVDFNLPSLSEDKPVQILTERYELVNTPGQYYLVMPVLAAKTDVDAHTITISVEDIPNDIEVEVNTFYSGNKFTHDTDKRIWVFDGTMLPGQGFSIVFKIPPDKQYSMPTMSPTPPDTMKHSS